METSCSNSQTESKENGVFEAPFLDDHSGIEEDGFYWKFGEIEKGPFFNVRECAKDYCATLTDKIPGMHEAFVGKTWLQIYEIAGISKEIRELTQW